MARRKSKWPKSSKYTTRRGRQRGPGAGPVVLVLALVAAGIWFVPRMNLNLSKTPRGQRVPAGAQALSDSTDAATRRGDWDRALTYAIELANVAPSLSGAQRKLSVAWHNYGTAMRMVDGAPRAAQRTSVGKIECDIRALTAADSARALAANDEEWLAAAELYGKTLEYLGLPVDALGIYAQMLQRRPNHPGASGRYVFLRDRLRNPLLSDQ